jgi:hypothetical protein
MCTASLNGKDRRRLFRLCFPIASAFSGFFLTLTIRKRQTRKGELILSVIPLRRAASRKPADLADARQAS